MDTMNGFGTEDLFKFRGNFFSFRDIHTYTDLISVSA